jgi:hypothetical protein
MNTDLLHHNREIVPPERPVIMIYRDEDSLYCNEFGEVHSWHPSHEVSHHVNRQTVCVHRLQPMPHTMLFGIDWVAKLHWQTCLVGPTPCYANRLHDIVTIGCDVIGPIEGCRHRFTARCESHWSYRLYRIRWWDQDIIFDGAYLGVWPD